MFWLALGRLPGSPAISAPYGDALRLFGGAEPGQTYIYTIVSDGHEQVLDSKEVGVVVKPGDHIYCLSAGGGGFGEPQGRDKAAREWDVKNGYVAR